MSPQNSRQTPDRILRVSSKAPPALLLMTILSGSWPVFTQQNEAICSVLTDSRLQLKTSNKNDPTGPNLTGLQDHRVWFDLY